MIPLKRYGDEKINNLVKQFCTAPNNEVTKFDLKSVANADIIQLDFEGIKIPIYSWGEGKKILLVHGWGSRASHMSLLARILSDVGFKVFTFDAPAHSSVSNDQQKLTSSMFEFGRATSAVANHLGDIHAVVGHSIGAFATIFAISGHLKFENFKFPSNKVVLISSPANVNEAIETFVRTNNLSKDERETLLHGLEKEFDFTASDYCVSRALNNINLDLMVVHDEDDDEVPISNAYTFKNTLPTTKLHITQKLGHKKILFHRETIKKITNFISDAED